MEDANQVSLREGFKVTRDAIAGRDAEIIIAPMTYPRGACFLIWTGALLLEAHWSLKRKKGLWRVARIEGWKPCVEALRYAKVPVFCIEGRRATPNGYAWIDRYNDNKMIDGEPVPELPPFEPNTFGPGRLSAYGVRLKMGSVCGYCTSLNDLISLVLGELRGVGL